MQDFQVLISEAHIVSLSMIQSEIKEGEWLGDLVVTRILSI